MSDFDDYDDDQDEDNLLLADLPETECSEVDSIRWVANNISRVDVSPVSCPSAISWTLLQECRRNVAFRAEFLTKMWPKLLPPKASLDNVEDETKFDGQVTMDLIDRIQTIKGKVENKVKEDQEPDPEESNYQSFEDFNQEDA